MQTFQNDTIFVEPWSQTRKHNMKGGEKQHSQDTNEEHEIHSISSTGSKWSKFLN